MVAVPRDAPTPPTLDLPMPTEPASSSSHGTTKRSSMLGFNNPWRYFQRRRENEAMRREETTRLAGIRRAERKEERARLRRAVLSGALGCYPLARAVLGSEGRILTDLNRNAEQIDGDAMGIAPGDVVVSSMMDDAGYLAPLDETDDNTRRDESDDDDAAPRAAARRSRRRNRRAGRGTNSANYTHEPRMYLVTRGRVDILAPGPGPIESNDDAMNEDANDDTGKKRKKKKKQKGTREGKEWHRAVGLGPGSCFSAPLQAIHGFDVPGGCKAVAGTGDLRLLTVPMSIVQRNGAVAVMEECRISTMQMAESTPWLAWVEPKWVRGFVIDSFVIERRGDERDVYTVGGDGTMGGIRRLGLDVPFVRRGGAVDAMRVVTEGAVTGAGGGGVVAAGGVFHESALDLDVVDLDAATSPHVASNDAIARVSPTECIAMHRDALRHHVTHSVYVKHSLASNAEAEALRVRLRRRLDTIRSDDVDTGRGHRSDADPEVITDEHLIAMGIMKDPHGGWVYPWRPDSVAVGRPGGRQPNPSSAPRGSTRRGKIRAALLTSMPFEGATDATLDKAIAEIRELTLMRGDLLAEEGGECWGVCVLERGELHAYRRRDDPHLDHSTVGWYHECVGVLGSGYVSGEIPIMFNTPNDATVVAACSTGGPTRLWGLSRAACERLAGHRDERWRLKENSRFVPFEREKPVFAAMERVRLEHQKDALDRVRRGLRPLTGVDKMSATERCLRALPHGLGGILLENVIRRASPVHGLEVRRTNEAIERTNAFIADVTAMRQAREERDRAQAERLRRRAEREAEVAINSDGSHDDGAGGD